MARSDDPDRRICQQKRMIGQTLDSAGLKPSQKRSLIEHLLLNEGHLREISSLLPGLLSLHGGRFEDLGFFEQAAFWGALQSCLGNGPAGAPFYLHRLLRIVFLEAGGEGRASPEGIPGLFVSRVREVVQQDPYPRVRIAAAQVLMRFGAPRELGTSLQDYLIGLLSPNAVSACGVLNFVISHFGSAAIREAMTYLNRAGRTLPPVLAHLLEAACEEHFSPLEFKRMMFQLGSREARSGTIAAPGDGPAEAGTCKLGPGERAQQQESLLFQSRRQEPASPDRGARHAGAQSRGREGEGGGAPVARGNVQRRFSRIRSGRVSAPGGA